MKYLLLLSIFMTGCVVNGPEIIGLSYPPFLNYNTQPLQQALINTDRESVKLKAFVKRSSYRQELLQALNQSEQANRQLYKLLQNPWNGFYLLNTSSEIY
jgi:hypothetical protein